MTRIIRVFRGLNHSFGWPEAIEVCLTNSTALVTFRLSLLDIMEYTDAPLTETQAGSTETVPCPYCGTPLPKGAQRCSRCDWTRQATETAEPRASDAMAILLSIIPGLGHIYKGHRFMGAVILFLITPIAIAFAILAALASAGWGILMLVPYWGAVMLHVWGIKDKIAPNITDEGEQY